MLSTTVDIENVPHWLRASGEPLLGWFSLPRDGRLHGSGVLVIGPIAYEYWTSYRSVRVLAERLAAEGHLVLRLDLRGMGDSSGNLWDPARLRAWSDDIATGVAELRARGAEHITVVGLRLGGLLAARVAPALGADRVVAWLPVASGRRYARELRLLSVDAPEGETTVAGPDARFFAGTVLSSELLNDLAALSADGITDACAATLVIDRAEQPTSEPFVAAIRATGGQVEERLLEGAEHMLDQPTEYATVPTGHIDVITGWLADVGSDDAGLADRGFDAGATLTESGVPVVEEVIRLGPTRLVAIETRPASGGSSGETVVFLNTGSEHHVGSGRVWVELARRLAARGKTALRVDFRGFGDSPDDGYAPGRPYDAHTIEDVRTIAEALHARGDRKVVLVGICAGAWVALRECWTLPIAGVVAFNPQLYWQPGDPVEATMVETRRRRTAERQRDERLGRRGVWNALDAFGIRPAAARWLDRIAQSPFPVHFLYEREDDGIDYLRYRLGRRTRAATEHGALVVRELDGLDHPMHRQWRRFEALAAIEAMLDDLRSVA
jgi:alpha-beta hydrolase superfamily lysophospholipase